MVRKHQRSPLPKANSSEESAMSHYSVTDLMPLVNQHLDAHDQLAFQLTKANSLAYIADIRDEFCEFPIEITLDYLSVLSDLIRQVHKAHEQMHGAFEDLWQLVSQIGEG
jgi:hypothetical protein